MLAVSVGEINGAWGLLDELDVALILPDLEIALNWFENVAVISADFRILSEEVYSNGLKSPLKKLLNRQ